MALLQLNVGLWINGKPGNIGPRTVVEEVIATLPNYGHVARVQIHPITGEPTVIIGMIVADNIELEAKIHFLCHLLQQDCIAGKLGDIGFLYGPNVADYGGEFNPVYWLEI